MSQKSEQLKRDIERLQLELQAEIALEERVPVGTSRTRTQFDAMNATEQEQYTERGGMIEEV